MNDLTNATPEERVAAFRSRHDTRPVEVQDPYLGRIHRCEADGIRVYPMRDGRWRHDTREATALLNELYGGTWFRRDADELERRLATVSRIVDLVDRDEDDEVNLEGMPEFNGAFR